MKTILIPLLLLLPAIAPAATAQPSPAPAQTAGRGESVVTLTGTLKGGRIAIGGETSGWALEYRDSSGPHVIEVTMTPDVQARARNGATVTAIGTFGTREYIERGVTQVFRISRLEDGGTAAPATAPAPAARGAATTTSTAPRTSRLPELTTERMSPAQRALAEEIVKVSSVGLGGPYNAMLRSPVMGERMFAMLDYLRFNTSVPRRLNEFAILIQARLWTSQVEWLAHYPLAIKEGISEATAADLKAGRRPGSMKEDEAAVYDFCMELSTTRAVGDATYARVGRVLSEQQIIDLVTVSGTYTTLAMMMNASGQGVPPGTTPPLPLLPSAAR